MSEVTDILDAVGRGEPRAASQLLPLVYDELRRLAARRLAREVPGQTLDATAPVHEAYLRLVDGDPGKAWEGRARPRGGGGRAEIPAPEPRSFDELLAIDAVLDRLIVIDPSAAELVKLRYFAGFSIVQAAEILGISPRSADRLWTYARAWLR